jgi:hypothetical protein
MTVVFRSNACAEHEDASRHRHRNAGFIRQRPVRLVAQPDKSGVPDELLPVCGGVKMRPEREERARGIDSARDILLF